MTYVDVYLTSVGNCGMETNSSRDTHQPGTSSGSSQFPEPSESPILKTVPIGQPYSRATPSRQM